VERAFARRLTLSLSRLKEYRLPSKIIASRSGQIAVAMLRNSVVFN